MGLFSTPEIDKRISPALIGDSPSDLKKVGRAQAAILSALAPDERVIFVSADTSNSTVWTFTDRRLLESQGKHVSYALPTVRIANTETRYMVLTNGRDVRYFVHVVWTGGPLRTVDRKFANSNGFLALERLNGEEDVRQIRSLISLELQPS